MKGYLLYFFYVIINCIYMLFLACLSQFFDRILAALTRKFKLHENVSLYSVAVKCPPNFTGADMYALCADAWFNAAKRKVFYSLLF